MAWNRISGDVEDVLYETVELLRASLKREDGQTMAEYALVLAMITIGVVATITALSGGVSQAINKTTGIV
jgi:Flp pilus assembly pilin Flp